MIPNAQADEYIITKLNLLFNYIYGEGEGFEIGLNKNDKKELIDVLSRLELYTEKTNAYSLMPADKLLDEKIMMWVVKEIYLSPHKVFLEYFTRKKLSFRYNKTKKYITKKADYRIGEIINYFIVSLHKEMEENSSGK